MGDPAVAVAADAVAVPVVPWASCAVVAVVAYVDGAEVRFDFDTSSVVLNPGSKMIKAISSFDFCLSSASE